MDRKPWASSSGEGKDEINAGSGVSSCYDAPQISNSPVNGRTWAAQLTHSLTHAANVMGYARYVGVLGIQGKQGEQNSPGPHSQVGGMNKTK